MASHSSRTLVRWRQQLEDDERVQRGELSPVAARRAVEWCTLTKIEKRDGAWRILGKSEHGERKLEYEPNRLFDYSRGAVSNKEQARTKSVLWGEHGLGGRWAVRVAYPWLLDRYEDARFLESFSKRKDGGQRRADAIEGALQASDGIDAYMYARQRIRGQSFDPHETNEDKYTATFHRALRFADGFRSPRHVAGKGTVADADALESRSEPQLLYALCTTDPKEIVAELLVHESVVALRDAAHDGTLFEKEYAGVKWRSAKRLEKETRALADEALHAACYWSLGGPLVAAGGMEAWCAQYPERDLLWHLVRDIYVDSLAIVDRRFAEPRKRDAHPLSLQRSDAQHDERAFRSMVDAIQVDVFGPALEDGSTPGDLAESNLERLDADEAATREFGCACAVALLLYPEVRDRFPRRRLEAIASSDPSPRARAAANWSLAMFDERTR
jgi:hypothetical protein